MAVRDYRLGVGPGGRTGTETVASVQRGDVSLSELKDDAEKRLGHWEPWLGAIVTRLDQNQIECAPVGPLSGLIVGVKDCIRVKGHISGLGVPERGISWPRSQDDAWAVKRLRDSGATIWASTALHSLCGGVVCPETRNPRHPELIAGGSSGGSAAAVASGLVHVALGTDTGGSTRIPAACCGIWGLKLTQDPETVDGVFPLAATFDSLGILANTVDDIVLTMAALRPGSAPAPSRVLNVAVAVTSADSEDSSAPGLPEAVRHATNRSPLLKNVRTRPITVDGELHASFSAELQAQAASAYAWLPDRALALLPPDVRDLVTVRDSGGGQAETWLSERKRLQDWVWAAFDDADVLVLPTLGCRVPRRRVAVRLVDDKAINAMGHEMRRALNRYTFPANALGLPALSMPTRWNTRRSAVQLVGRPGSELTLLKVGMEMQRQWQEQS